ncbi:nephrin-like [Rhagoletis pomonella]|uniref:nephrin-like n=1 Tax=Rhagoletis pomonella TaxID=28610 RepID=UPI0017867E86|nr:nephrin-like [Rhagoletis pomonella]
MGSSLNPDDIKEGDDVYFECVIQSNPKPYKMSWFHNGKELHSNVSAGIILSDQSLVLQSVSRASAGDYTCLAVNSEGKGASNPVSLHIRFAPICATDHEELLGALKHETLMLKCEVDSSPPAEAFTWTFNSSGEQTELPARLHSTETGMSRLNYTPSTDLDYGTISCWGRNSIGMQKSPCVFQIVAAGRPFPLQNCTVTNQSTDSIQVDCVEGFDGGLPQGFILELVELNNLRLARNLSLPVCLGKQKMRGTHPRDNIQMPMSIYAPLLAPICATDHEELLGALKHETLMLKCEVDSSPPAEAFTWTFNSSGEQTELPARLHSTETGMSRLNYTPSTDLDYGTISCWGRNSIGMQKSPCVFQIVAAGRPFPLQNCTVTNQSTDSIQVDCVEGFDGGLPQGFILELVELNNLRLARNLSLPHPPVSFLIENLDPTATYRMIIFAMNAKGRSEPTIIDDINFKGVAKFTGKQNKSIQCAK